MSTQLIQLDSLTENENAPDSVRELDIQKARCNRYVPNREKKDAKELCYCGRPLELHEKSVIEIYEAKGVEENEKWDIYDPLNRYVAEDGLTDGYGDIKFIDNSEHKAKYIRVHYKTEPAKMVELLFKNWKLNEPKLLISVTGGAQKFSLKSRLRDVFRRGLVKAAVSTSAWISTGGFNVGVMKHVGEAIRNSSTSLNTSEKIVVLGIASWTMVLHNETLAREPLSTAAKKEPIEYRLTSKSEKDRRQPLDPNHSHFILVDNAQIKFGGEIDFRAALESAISQHRRESPIPIVVLVLEGGVGTLKTVLESAKKGTPCVFVEGSGKCADIFAYALKYMVDTEKEGVEMKIDSRLESEIKLRIQKEWPDSDLEKTYKQIEQTLKYRDLLTAFTLDAEDQTPEIDVAILTALLKAKKGNYIAQLKLSLRWNRVDIARNYIFNQDIKWESKQLDEVMYCAIMDDSVDFVNLLLQNGFNLSMFLTNRCLLKLYNDGLINKRNKSISYLLLTKNRSKMAEKKNYDFYDIGSIIQTLVEDLYEPKFKHFPYNKINLVMALAETNNIGKLHSHWKKAIAGVTAEIHSELDLDARCEDPEHELFIFSILLMRPAMSKVFWREGSNEIFLALLTTKIFKTLASINDEEGKILNELSDEFEEMAISVLNDCYSRDEKRAELLLIKEIPQFGNLTCIQVAVSANDLTFMSHPCVQGLLTKLWYSKIMPDTPKPIIGLSLLFPPIGPFCIEYLEDRRERMSSKSKTKENENVSEFSNAEVGFVDSGKKLSYFEKIYFFVKAPVVKFLYNQISYILFLMLFSYIMLCDFYPIPRPDDDDDDNGGGGGGKLRIDYEDSDENSGGYKLPISIAEVVLIFWVIMHTLDQIRQFFETDAKVLKARLRVYFYNFWNSVELVAIVLYFIGMIFRFIPSSQDTYITARIIFCVDLIFWYLKALSYYAVIRNLGPKLVMINRMINELMYFVLIVIVFAFAFGVSTQSLMFHNQELSPELLKEVFFPSYFVIGGEYYTLENILDSDCEQPDNNTLGLDEYSQDDCPEDRGRKVTMAIYVGYLIILNILLVNLLIAIFSNTFEEVQEEADKIWKFQRYSLVYEYSHKPMLAAPFSVFSYMISVIRFFLRPIRKRYYKRIGEGETSVFKRLFYYLSKDWRTNFRAKFDRREAQMLTKWEDLIADEYLHAEEQNEKETQDYKIQLALDKIELLNRKFDEIIDKREDLKEQVDKCEEKIDKVLEILMKNQGTINVKPKSVEQKPDRILSPSNISSLTAVETGEEALMLPVVVNNKSRTPHYPKSNVTRSAVPDSKVPWSVSWSNYGPIEYTSKTVLTDSKADTNLLAYPLVVRTEIDFNQIDKQFDVDRRSCIGKYTVYDGIPLNPLGRTGLKGRGSLLFWGPNHAIEAIFTRWKRDKNGKYAVDKENKRTLQFVVIERSIQFRDWHLPHVMLEHASQQTPVLVNNLLPQLFDKSIVAENLEKFKQFLDKGVKIDEYYKDSQRNTDNAWIETTVNNYHDETGGLLSKVPLNADGAVWKDFSKNIEAECEEDWKILKRIAESRQASLE